MSGEKCVCKESVNGKLCRAAHKRRQQNRHFAVALGGQRSACHNAGDSTAKADEHGDDASSRKTDFAQQFVHDKGDARHVTAVLKYGKEEEQRDNGRQEGENASHTAENGVDDKRMYGLIYVERGQKSIGGIGQCGDAKLGQIGQCQADDAERQVEYRRHDCDKAGNCGILAREHAVNTAAAQVGLAFLGLYDRFGADFIDERESHICDCRRAVKSALLLHLADDVLDHFFFIFVKRQLLCNKGLALCQLCCRKSNGDSRRLRMILDQMHDSVEATVDRTALVGGVTKVLSARALLIARYVKCVGDKLVNALVLCRGNGHYGDSQRLLQLVYSNGTAVFSHLVHHVQRKNHGNVELHQLHGKIEVALDVGGVNYVYDAAGVAFEYEITRNYLLA